MPRVAWKSFTEGRALVRGLGLKGERSWRKWSKSEQRPSDIPSDPPVAYRDDGWISWPDWLGNEVRVLAKDMLPFTVARAYVRKLNLRNNEEWRAWSKSGQRPSNIPASPQRTYRDADWISLPDWLGYGSDGGAASSRSSSSSSVTGPYRFSTAFTILTTDECSCRSPVESPISLRSVPAIAT
jgi:hypothetical protein